MKERQKHIEAFEVFYAMEHRSLRKLEKKLGITYKSIQCWSKEFSWDERITQRDIRIQKKVNTKLSTKIADTIVNEKANYRKVIKLAMAKLISNITDGKMDYKIADIDKLVRLDMFLLGENDSSMRVDNNMVLNDDDREAIKDLREKMGCMVDELGEA